MSFFDDKEEILNIELTSHGKYLLSKGKFKPEYYAFFDDDVIYDSLYTQLTESQNETNTRILEETPILKPQSTFTSVENRITETRTLDYSNINILKAEENSFSSEKNYSPILPLGKSSYNSEYYPAWNLILLSGTLSSSAQFIDNSYENNNFNQTYLKIPQINLNTNKYSIKISNDSNIQDPNYEIIGQTPDGLKYAYYKESIDLIDLMEINVEDIKKNFDIEVFMKEEILNASTLKKDIIWKQLSFRKKPIFIKDDILLESPENYDLSNNPELMDPTYVEHFLEILVDEEIELPPEAKAKIQIYDSDIKTVPLCPDPQNPCCPDAQKS